MRFLPRRRKDEQRAISYQDVWGSGGNPDLFGNGIDRALRLVPVYAGTRLIADAVSSLPLQAYRKTRDGRERIPTPSLLESPSAYGTPYDWVFRAMTSLLLRGNAWGMKVAPDTDGSPRTVEWLHPDDVSVDESAARPRVFYRGREIPMGDLLHIPGYTLPGSMLGVSPIQAYAVTIDSGLFAAQFGRDWFKNGTVPSAHVKNTAKTLSPEQAAEVKDRVRGLRNGEPWVTGMDWEWKALSVTPDEAQFIDTMRFTATQIAAIYGIPPEMIGGESGKSMTYANTEQQAIQFATYTLRPWVTRLEAAISRLLPKPQYVKFNVDSMIRVDTATRWQVHETARRIGATSVNEIRALEDMPAIAGGDDYTPFGSSSTPSPNDGDAAA